MDKLDWKILKVLDWNGRESINKIAKLVASSKVVVAYRIKKLEKDGIILRYFPIIDMYKLRYYTSRLYFDLEELDEKREREFIDFLDKELNVGTIFRMDYPYRYGCLVWTKSIYEIEELIIKIKLKLGRTLIKYSYSLFCSYKLYPKDYLFGNDAHKEKVSLIPESTVNFDGNDFKILNELAKDARISTVQISKNLRIPQTTVCSKIKSLEKKKIVAKYRTEIDFIKLGYINYFLEIYLDINKNLRQIETWADLNKNVVWLQKIIGVCDIEIEVEVKDRNELEMLLNEMRTKFPNIRKIIFCSQEYKKLTFIPWQQQNL